MLKEKKPKTTHICDQIAISITNPVESTTGMAANDLKNQDSKAINIRFHGELTKIHILRSHVSAGQIIQQDLSLHVTEKW